uniref:NADH-ubiquinone oxidoreductase chain 1 n=1 Tax=Bemisia tabaci TaxID=7038 RepID=A0A345U6C3_BEMTA|nr:NADH dehydrogenase subunit 1 [Bemisia tabaci]AXI96009.1 NADH dehydrogenase subunit 1 [Bemisia tabaci]
MFLFTLNFLFLMIMVMISVAFFTLMERKMIGYSQLRKGPNKILMMGIMQPIADAMKLITKEFNMNYSSNFTMYLMAPALNIICSLMTWIIFPFKYSFSFMKMAVLMMLSCAAFNVVTIMMMSWSSNSNYAFIGMIRTISQLISYEINLIMILITVIIVTEQMNFVNMSKVQKYIQITMLLFPLVLIWMITTLAETNRTPFDFSEGESELISGFNIEYSSTSFMMLFLSEYCSILIMSLLTTCMFTNLTPINPTFYMVYLVISFVFIWTRTTLPRFRYDKLMKFNWIQVLPMTTTILSISFPMKIL